MIKIFNFDTSSHQDDIFDLYTIHIRIRFLRIQVVSSNDKCQVSIFSVIGILSYSRVSVRRFQLFYNLDFIENLTQ